MKCKPRQVHVLSFTFLRPTYLRSHFSGPDARALHGPDSGIKQPLARLVAGHAAKEVVRLFSALSRRGGINATKCGQVDQKVAEVDTVIFGSVSYLIDFARDAH